ncbi:hypothetical protein SAMN05444411_102487 [Lutibacter oricola]|uniref:Uncharacterized protein n=1 Tax=Lutibacter oricola TaxID=762486 RepID=A0A1H2XKU8_9FLAO|nr:hypothetical protein [Lutibacter oricola]SDW92919.1 hypothetical protein SAMN05444411_102487 [Lutibacter oricola]
MILEITKPKQNNKLKNKSSIYINTLIPEFWYISNKGNRTQAYKKCANI